MEERKEHRDLGSAGCTRILRPCSPCSLPTPIVSLYPWSARPFAVPAGYSPHAAHHQGHLAEVPVAIEVQDRGRSHLLSRQLQLQDKQDQPEAGPRPQLAPSPNRTHGPPAPHRASLASVFPLAGLDFAVTILLKQWAGDTLWAEVLPERMRREEALA